MAREFFQTLPEIRGGVLQEELTDAMRKVVCAVGNTNKPGVITLKLTFKPGSSGSIEVLDELKTKVPELSKGSSLFFATPENYLVRDNPRQDNLPGIRSLAQTTPEYKEVSNG